MRTLAILVTLAMLSLAVPTGSAAAGETAGSSNTSDGSLCGTSVSSGIQCAEADVKSVTTCAWETWYEPDRWGCSTQWTLTVSATGIAYCAKGRVMTPSWGTIASSGDVCASAGAAQPRTVTGSSHHYPSLNGETRHHPIELCGKGITGENCKVWAHAVYEPGPPTTNTNVGAIVDYAVTSALSALAAIPT